MRENLRKVLGVGRFFESGFSFRGLLAAAGFLALLATVAGWYGEYAWWLDGCAHFRALYVAIFALLAIAHALERRWLFALGAGGLAVVNLAPLKPYLIDAIPPRHGPAPDGATRAMMINVNTSFGDASRVAAAIRIERPDILLLLEVDRRWLERLKPELARFPNQLTEPRGDNFGIALFSRLPWADARVVVLGEAGLPSVLARVSAGQGRVWIFGTHAPPPMGRRMWALRNGHLSELARQLRGMEGPLVVLGDLNATPWSYHFGRLMDSAGLDDSARGRRLMGTWPVFARPFSIPIDHCLLRGGVVVHGRRHGPDVGSDHLPVIVDFTPE